VAPLVYEAHDWAHGVFLGASMASETTAAATGEVGVVRRDPMAMRPFCGYHIGDYLDHWLKIGEQVHAKSAKKLPRIFHVNWFRTGDDGRFLWPGFSENLRVLAWILDRCEGRASATETPIGYVPAPGSLPTQGLGISDEVVDKLLQIDPDAWVDEAEDIGRFFAEIGDRLPPRLAEERARLETRLRAMRQPRTRRTAQIS
jgi:phosphoenolpyruvate carboxykinase (GTP)